MQVNIHQINTVQQYGLLNGGNAGGHLTSSLDPSSAAADTSLIGLKSIIGYYTSKNAQSTSGPRGEAPFGSNPSGAAGGLIQLAKVNLNSTGRVGTGGGGGGFNLKIKLKMKLHLRISVIQRKRRSSYLLVKLVEVAALRPWQREALRKMTRDLLELSTTDLI